MKKFKNPVQKLLNYCLLKSDQRLELDKIDLTR